MNKNMFKTALVKFLDWNSIRANQCYSESFQNVQLALIRQDLGCFLVLFGMFRMAQIALIEILGFTWSHSD